MVVGHRLLAPPMANLSSSTERRAVAAQAAGLSIGLVREIVCLGSQGEFHLLLWHGRRRIH